MFLVVRVPVLAVVHNMLPGVVLSVVPCGSGTMFLVVRVPVLAVVRNMLPGVVHSVVPCGSGTSIGCCSQHSTGCC